MSPRDNGTDVAEDSAAPRLRITGLGKRFGEYDAIADADIEVRAGETVSLLGPSGCGKTTTLRLIAGFYRPDAGSIEIDGRTVAGKRRWVPPEERRLSMVFQNYVLWPHMSVAKNIGFGMKIRGYRRREIGSQITRLCGMLGLGGLENRFPHELSGGQQQRVAVARSLAVDPSLLLLDEPFSNLDAKLRLEMRAEMKSLLGSLGTTAIYVTHDQEEAMAVSDRIVLMNAGRIVEQGAPRDLFERPSSVFTARFFGCTTFLTGFLVSDRGRLVLKSSTDSTSYEVPPGVDAEPGREIVLAARPDSIEIAPADAGPGWMNATVLSSSYIGTAIEAQLSLGGVVIQARIPGDQWIEGQSTVSMRFAAGKVHVLPGDTEAGSVLREDVTS